MSGKINYFAKKFFTRPHYEKKILFIEFDMLIYDKFYRMRSIFG